MSSCFHRSVQPTLSDFTLSTDDRLQAPETWAARAPNLPAADAAAVSVLMRLMEAELALPEGDGLRLDAATVAGLDPTEIRRLGLPPPAPVVVQLEGRGLITDPEFRIDVRLLRPDRRPMVGARREGMLLTVGDERYTLLDPHFSLLMKIDELNSAIARDPRIEHADRLLRWGEVRELLGEESLVEGMLTDLEVVRADAFSLSPFRGRTGGVDFDPLLLVRRVQCRMGRVEDQTDLSSSTEPEEPLTPADRDRYQQQFRQRAGVQRSVLLPSRTVVVLSPSLHRVLETVHRIQRSGSAAERRALVLQPRAVLRDQVPELDEEYLEGVFVEAQDYGERVIGIGAWQPPVLPFLQRAQQPWLPPEMIGLRVGDQTVPLPKDPERLRSLLDEVNEAILGGRTSLEVDGRQVPATAATADAIRTLIEAIESAAQARPGDEVPGETPEEPTSTGEPTVLLIADNLEDGLFRRELTPRTGVAGVPTGLRTTLLPHQREGLQWLQGHWLAGSPGALLADDMGLGKTLQGLAFLVWVARQQANLDLANRHRPALIVAPTGLLRNWMDEAATHLETGELASPCPLFGAGLARLRDPRARGGGLETDAEEGLPALNVDALRREDWVLASYETVRDYQFSLARIDWSLVIFDEAQKIKNPAALMTVAAKALRAQFLLTMTGTPVENRAADLWCIVDTCQPGSLGTLKSFVATVKDEDAGTLKGLNDRLRNSDSPAPSLLLRRLKEEHLQGLPTKRESVVDGVMPPAQAAAYAAAVRSARELGKASKASMLRALQQMRSISLHPGEWDPAEGDAAFLSASARLSKLVDILDEVSARGEKALVFLEDRQVQGVLAEIIQRRYGQPTLPLVINGAVAGDHRKRRADLFQSRPGFEVMILSPRAGGVGLTLTAANHVVHLSRWWNPAVEAQCTDRVYRIGQNRPVTVHILRAIHPEFREHSFDVRLHDLLERKKQLFQTLMMPPEATEGDLEAVFDATTGAR